MFPLTLNLLFLFTLSTPIAGWAALRMNKKSLCGVYASAGLAASGITLYYLFSQVSFGVVSYSLSIGLFSANLRIDMLSVFMASIFIGLGLAAAVYSIKYMEKDSGLPLYYTLLVAMVCGMVGVVFSGDLFTLFVFWELMSISSYVLVAFRKEKWEAVEASLKYLIMSAAGSATTLLGISLLYGMSGTLDFQGLALAFNQSQPNNWLYLSLLLIITGFGVKAAIVPLHTWLPDAHSAAPSPISALLAGVVIETGVYALCRTFFTAFLSIQVQWFSILVILSLVTMVVGNLMPLLQNDIKRLLAYSSVGHVGYMLVGLVVGTQIGLTGTVLHIFNHAIMKGAAFLCAGAIIYRIGTRQLDDMAGIGRKMPVTATVFAVSLFALIGMPPLNGFVSELTIITGSFQANLAWLGIAIVLNSVLSAAYYLRTIRALIMPIRSEKIEKVKEAPLIMLIPLCIMAGLIILFGIWPDPLISIAQQSAAGLFPWWGTG